MSRGSGKVLRRDDGAYRRVSTMIRDENYSWVKRHRGAQFGAILDAAISDLIRQDEDREVAIFLQEYRRQHPSKRPIEALGDQTSLAALPGVNDGRSS